MATPKPTQAPKPKQPTSVNREPRTLYLATRNEHKVEEFQSMLGGEWDVRSIEMLEAETGGQVSWEETGDSFEANSRIKARAVRRLTRSAVLADDSGLVVDALGGAPGIHSSRYAGMPAGMPRAGIDSANTAKLLAALDGVPEAQRTARFVCCLVFIDEGGQETVINGMCEGRIGLNPAGKSGFGYDPVFVVPGRGCTMAELPDFEKNMISHRAAAVARFLEKFL